MLMSLSIAISRSLSLMETYDTLNLKEIYTGNKRKSKIKRGKLFISGTTKQLNN